MKVNSVNYTSPSQNNNYRSSRRSPSFGNFAVGLASFIENNGFLGEFLTIDSCGMMIPRTAQGYTRNMEELGHLNYKAGREEMVRELLSGPAFFYVPLMMMTLVGLLRGKTAKVETKVLNTFKSVMKKGSVNIKNANETKEHFINNILKEAFDGYKDTDNIVGKLSDLMKRNVNEKMSFSEKIANLFKKKTDKKTTHAMLRAEAEELVTKLNKQNGRFLDNAGAIELPVHTVNKEGVTEIKRETFDISGIFKDMENYLDDFTQKAQKSSDDAGTFIDKFHKKAKDLRNLTNILSVGALSAFLVVIPKIYQTGKTFPGKDGLNTGEAPAADTASETKKEAV